MHLGRECRGKLEGEKETPVTEPPLGPVLFKSIEVSILMLSCTHGEDSLTNETQIPFFPTISYEIIESISREKISSSQGKMGVT